jgi:hypothetical protein
MRDGGERHLSVGRGRRGRQIERSQPGQGLLQRRIDFQDDAILVRLGVDRGNDALPEGVVEHVVDRGRSNAETAGRSPVDDEVHGQSLLLQIACNVGELRLLAQLLHEFWHPGLELGRVGVFEHEMIRRAADRCVDGQILHRLHVQRDAGDA